MSNITDIVISIYHFLLCGAAVVGRLIVSSWVMRYSQSGYWLMSGLDNNEQERECSMGYGVPYDL